MAMETQRSRALHNFKFPGGLKWGNQRTLRCIHVDSDSQVYPLREFTSNASDSSGHRHQQIQLQQTTGDGDRDKAPPDSDFVFLGSHQMGCTPPQVTNGGRGIGGNGITVKRENAMFDNQKANASSCAEVSASPPAAMSGKGDANRPPWDLRKRRASCKTPASGFVVGVNGGVSCAGGGGRVKRVDGARPSCEISLIRAAAAVTDKSLRSGGNVVAMGGEKIKREKFSVSLSKTEIEEDFLAFNGHKPPRRPKKRAKIVQRNLDTLFPGLWLTEITPELYKVSGAAP